MRKVAVFIALFTCFSFLSSCSSGPSRGEIIFGGEHALRKMAERTSVNSSLSGSFFLFVGNVSGEQKTEVDAKFAWKMNDGTWAISSLPIEKIRVKFDENAISPTVRFRWAGGCIYNHKDIQGLMDNCVIYMLLTVREQDWPIQVSLPLNK